MASSTGQRDARIIERIVVAPTPRRTPPPLVITFTRRDEADGPPEGTASERTHEEGVA